MIAHCACRKRLGADMLRALRTDACRAMNQQACHLRATRLRLVQREMGWPAGYYLWCWENPHQERAVERIEFIPRGSRFIVAGITTSDVDEHPFVGGPARPVRLVAKDGRNGVLDIDVDRGVATYPQPRSRA